MRIGYVGRYKKLEFVPYEDFSEIEEIGSGGYGVVYAAKYKSVDRRVLKSFKDFNQTPELLVSEVRTLISLSRSELFIVITQTD